MKLRKILLAVAGLALMLNASAQKSQRYYVAKPGTLVELTTEAEANENHPQLTLQGKRRTGLIQTVFMYILPIAFRHMPSASKWTKSDADQDYPFRQDQEQRRCCL